MHFQPFPVDPAFLPHSHPAVAAPAASDPDVARAQGTKRPGFACGIARMWPLVRWRGLPLPEPRRLDAPHGLPCVPHQGAPLGRQMCRWVGGLSYSGRATKRTGGQTARGQLGVGFW